MATNPIIEFTKHHSEKLNWDALDFSAFKTDYFNEAIDYWLEVSRNRFFEIINHAESPDFNNTFLALSVASEELDITVQVFYNLLGTDSTDELQKLAEVIGPKLSAFANDINLNPSWLKRVTEVHAQQDPSWTREERSIVEKTYREAVRNGAQLKPDDKEVLRKLDAELSQLAPKFSDHVLKATQKFSLHLTSDAQVSGLPAHFLDMARAQAAAKGLADGWLITLDMPSYMPFMKYADHRPSRETLWKAYASRAFNDDFDNQDCILRMLQLKEQRSQLLGFKNHAHFVLEERMAKTPEKVQSFIDRMLPTALAAARRDVTEVKNFAHSSGFQGELMPWDFSYYAEKLKKQKYEVDEESLRPYFEIKNVVAGMFATARKLYNLNFKTITGIPVYHPEVEVYEVTDTEHGHIGLFYADFFPRPSKRNGAWMTAFKDQGYLAGKVRRPHVAICCNFTRPVGDTPALLTFDEVRTLFHEFGHALHGLLSQCQYRNLSGTNVLWDFVELPSQIMENWTLEPECLALIARHYKTGAEFPESLRQKLVASERFLAGYQFLRQLSFSALDLAWYTTPTHQISSVAEFEDKILDAYRVLPPVADTNMSCSFGHIFGGGYSAGYYSYKWAEVLDADAFEFFKEQGVFNPHVARAFRTHILEKGGTEDPMVLYKNFRGREPDPEALLRRDGLSQ